MITFLSPHVSETEMLCWVKQLYRTNQKTVDTKIRWDWTAWFSLIIRLHVVMKPALIGSYYYVHVSGCNRKTRNQKLNPKSWGWLETLIYVHLCSDSLSDICSSANKTHFFSCDIKSRQTQSDSRLHCWAASHRLQTRNMNGPYVGHTSLLNLNILLQVFS